MPVIRVNHNKNYTVMSNVHLRDTNLSLRAKGLLSMMLSLPPDWDYSVEGLIAINKENVTAIKSALKELRDNGYLIVTKKLPNETESGRFEYIYDIFEEKQAIKKQGIEILPIENLPVEILPVENQSQLNKDNIYKDNKNKDIQNKEKPFASDDMNAVFNEWLQYKKEKKQTYQETGLRQLINRLTEDIKKHGERTVINAIKNSMSQGWAGIYIHADDQKQNESPASYDIDAFEKKMNTTVPKLRKKV